MSVLEIYINWVNSVLGEAGGHVDGVEAVQDGKVLCDLIDVLAPDAGLLAKVKASGECTPLSYTKVALEHMKSHGIKIKFPPEDIIHNEIKSLLDILWILILNYGIHSIGQNAFQRSVGIGKKQLLEWCQDELGTTFDHRNTLTFNLCNGNWFVQLLERVAGCSMQKSKDTAEYIEALLTEIQDRYSIMKDIIRASDIVDGTVDEHTLMIYLSLLRRRASNSERHKRREMLSTDGKAAAMAKIHFFEKRARSLSNDSQRSRSADSVSEPRVSRGRSQSSGGAAARSSSDQMWPPSSSQRPRARGLFDQVAAADGNETSDWSSTGSLVSGREKGSPKDRGEGDAGGGGLGDEMLHQAISERVTEVTEVRERKSSLDELVASAEKRLGKEAESQRLSEKETDTLSDFSSSSLSRDKPNVPRSVAPNGAVKKDEIERHPWSDNRTGSAAVRASVRNGAAASGGSDSDYSASSHSHQHSDALKPKDRKSEGKYSNGNARVSPVLTPDTAGLHSSTPVPRPEAPVPTTEERVTIRIKRPRDYIHQWEDTMDRLSNVSATDKIGSPRTPLISSYSSFQPTRSRSYEPGTSTPQTGSPQIVSPSYNRRNTELQRRSKSTTLPTRAPQITVSHASSNGYHNSVKTTSSNAYRDTLNNGTSSVQHAIHTPVTRSGLETCEEPVLTSILDRLPPNMRQQARDASKFLMQSTGPEVMALMDAIKRARVGGPPQETTETQLKYQSSPSDASEQTILKRREFAPTSSQPSGTRVRFQPQSRSLPAHLGAHQESSSSQGNSLSTAPLPPTSPRVQSTSPRRRALQSSNGVQSNGDGAERGSHRMLSISPNGHSRSRSLSPRAVRDVSASTVEAGGAARASNSRDGSSSLPLSMREDLLLKNLAMHNRVVEDERPSARLIALTSSPRADPTTDSPGRLHPISPRRPTDRLSVGKLYPEVTRLDLGLDSDRSYVSHDDIGLEGNDNGAVSPHAPARRGGGGAGRMPRREAWEQQRRRKGEVRTSSTFTAKDDVTTPEGQSRFIEVLCKEIDALKAKVDSIEEDTGRRSLSRASRSPSAGTPGNTRQYTAVDLRDGPDRMTFQPQRRTAHIPSLSPRRDRATSCPLLETSSRSPLLAGPRKSPRNATSQTRRPRLSSGGERHVNIDPLSIDTSAIGSGAGIYNGIPLGYSSPVQSVTPEVWGHDLTSPDQGFEPGRQDNWKRLITTRHLSEQQTIELKQALACALVENDILTAKLNNARHEIHDKLHHTNGVLDDCRRHLAKSQAENQELRTILEQERSKSHGFEARIREMETNMNEVKVGKQQLESELNETTSRLNRSLSETKPGVDSLKSDNARMVSRLAVVENENETLREDAHKLKSTQHKAMLTMDELRECLSKVRRERQELFEEVSFLQRREQTARVRQIMDTYQEKGVLDQRETEPAPHRFYLNTSSRNASFYESDDSDLIDDDIENEIAPNVRSRANAFGKRSASPPPARRSLSQGRHFGYDELSPTRGDREIYPHRKSYTPRSRSISPRPRERYSARSPRYFGSNSTETGHGRENTLIDQTLQEIERDLQRERETILSAADSAMRRPRPSEASSALPSTKRRKPYGAFSASSSPSGLGKKQLRQHSGSRSRSPLSQGRRQSSPLFPSTQQHHSPSGEPIYPRSHYSRDTSADGGSRNMATLLNSSFSSVHETRQQTTRSGSTGSGTAWPSRDSDRGPFREHQSTPGSPARSPRYFPRTAHSPPTRLAPDEKEQLSVSGKPCGRGDTGPAPAKARPLHAKSGKGEIARNLQREFDKEDKLLNSLANSSVIQNKSWFEMQRLISQLIKRISESDGDDTGINSSMSSRSSCERPLTGRKKAPFLSEEQRRYADELIQKYTGNVPH